MTLTLDDFDPNLIVSKIRELRDDGKSLREIAGKVGKSHTFVREVLRQQGYDTNSRPRKDTTERDARVIELYGAPERPDIQEVARLAGLSYNTTRGILSRAGATRGRGRPSADEPKRNRKVISYRPEQETMEKLNALAVFEGISLDTVVDRQIKRAIKEGYL